MANELVIFTGVVMQSTALVLSTVEPDPIEVQKLTEEEKELKAQSEKILAEVEKLTTAIRIMDMELQQQALAQVKLLQALQAEEAALIDHMEAQSEEDEADWVFDEDGNRLDENGDIIVAREDDDPLGDLDELLKEHNAKISEAAEKKSRKERRADKKKKTPYEQAKELFRKIAKLTHPDKTSSTRMHELFREAKEARENMDVAWLELILRKATSSQHDLFNMLLLRVETLRKELQEAEAARFMLYLSDPYKMFKDWQYPEKKNNVTEHFRRTLDRNIQGIKARIRALDPTRYNQESVSFFGNNRTL